MQIMLKNMQILFDRFSYVRLCDSCLFVENFKRQTLFLYP